jgi:predicted ATP-dependent endonuclease of OLD family
LLKLTRVRIQNFRSIEDSEEFNIDDLTCLVGKNEAGKTALLQALHAVRPLNQAKTTYDVTQEYPRRFVTRFKERHKNSPPRVVTTWWELSDEAKRLLTEEFGAEALTGNSIEIAKNYQEKGTTWSIPLDEKKVVQNLISQAQLSGVEKRALGNAVASAEQLNAALTAIAEKTPKHTALLARLAEYRDQNIYRKGIDLISDLVPKFFYTSHYDRMSGQVSVEKLVADQQQKKVEIGDEIFLQFLQLAGTSLKDLQAATKFEELISKCEAASNDITEQIFKYWTQNDALEVKLEFSQGRPEDPAPFNSGTVVRARVWNTLHRASVPFSERSAGFVWFFSFLVQFAAMRGEGNVIILLDEPGLTLHGKAQADLLRYMVQELLPHHQVIYSTHSPFMIPSDRFLSVRIVEDVVIKKQNERPEVRGTKVRKDVLVTDRDTLFPLQGALGYDIVQSMFIGKNTLLVEGPSDILYLQALSDALKQRGRVGLDPRWTVCPSGGIDKVWPFVSLFGGNHLNVAVLTDFGKGDKRKVEELRRSEILQAGSLYTAADFAEKVEADVEDLFECELFVEIVNSAYNLGPEHKLNAEKLLAADNTTVRQVKQAEAAFRVMPESIPTYDHFTPASWLLRNLAILEAETDNVEKTLARAERAFKIFNALLKPDVG